MKKLSAWLLLLALALTGCAGDAKTAAEPDPVPVRVSRAISGSISEEISFSGEVAAGREVQVMPKTAGRVAAVEFAVGQEVKKGDLLVRLEAEELAVMVKQAEAALEMARANLKNARSGAALAQLKAAEEQSLANLEAVKSNLARMEMLYEEGAVSLQQLEGVRLQHRVAESQYNLAREQAETFRRGEGQLEILAAQVRQAEAGLEMARLNYRNSLVTAPVSGVVSLRNAEVGAMVAPGAPVAVIADMERVLVTARVTEQTLRLLAPGMAVAVEVPSLGAVFAGEVREVAPAAAAGGRSYPVRIALAEAKEARPGMFARVRVAAASRAEAVLVPRAALLEQGGVFYAYSVRDGRAKRREVTVGLRDENYVEVQSGFAPGDLVVTAGHHFLRDGLPVLVEEGEVR